MKCGQNKTVSRLVIAAITLITLGGLLTLAGMRINISQSIAPGLYWTTSRVIQKGEYVIFCPPDWPGFQEALARGYINPGFCPGGYGYLMKQVLGVTGDVVSISADGVLINDRPLPHSRPLLTDDYGRSLPRLIITRHTLTNSELLLMTDHSSTSYDGRYFGWLSKSQVKAVIVPVITWGTVVNLFYLEGQ